MKKALLLYAFVAALGGLLFGFDTAVINGALPFFRDYLHLEKAREGWAVSSALVGCVLGAVAVGRPADVFGRRTVLRVLAFLFLASAVGTALAWDLSSFVFFRFIGGLGVGGASVISPVYISEISPPAYRGRLTITFQLAIVVGILAALFCDYLLMDVGPANWRWMFGSEALPAGLFLGLLFLVRRSPRWLVERGMREEAGKVLEAVSLGEDTGKLLDEIQASIDQEVIGKFRYLFRMPYLKLVIIGILVGMFNQFTGINIVMYYSSQIFISARFSAHSALGQSVVIGLTNLVFTLLAMAVIDRIGRRVMLLIGTLGMTFFLAGFSLAYLYEIEGFVLLAMLIGFAAFFAFSQGAVIWVLFGELFPNNIRSRGASIGSFSHWFFNALTIFLFPVIAQSFKGEKGASRGIGYVFAFYALATLVSFFFFKKYLVETKGRSLEQLEKDLL